MTTHDKLVDEACRLAEARNPHGMQVIASYAFKEILGREL
jgi:hypothetical protein